jgi:hypothetical protein
VINAARYSSYFYFVCAEYWVALVFLIFNYSVPPYDDSYLLYLQYKLWFTSVLQFIVGPCTKDNCLYSILLVVEAAHKALIWCGGGGSLGFRCSP